MKQLLYIHGFNSAKSDKIDFLAGEEMLTDSISLDKSPKRAIEQLEEYVENCRNELHLVGMSLGGFYAIYLTEKYGLRNTVLINPSLAAPENLRSRIGEQVNYKSGERYVFGKAEIAESRDIAKEFDVGKLNEKNYLCFVGIQDEVVKPDTARRIFSRTILLDTGHRVSGEMLRRYSPEICDFMGR